MRREVARLRLMREMEKKRQDPGRYLRLPVMRSCPSSISTSSTYTFVSI